MISESEIQTAIDGAAADGFEMVGLPEMWPHLSERARAHIFAQRADLWPIMTPDERSGTMWMDTAEANLRRHQRDEARAPEARRQ